MDTCDGWQLHPAVTGATVNAQVAYADALMSRIRYQASRLAMGSRARVESTRALAAQAQALRTDIARVQCAISSAATEPRPRSVSPARDPVGMLGMK